MTLTKIEEICARYIGGRDVDWKELAEILHAAWERELDDLKEIAARWMAEGVTQKDRADAAEARVKELERQIAQVARFGGPLAMANSRLAALRLLLKEAWGFPDYPSPGEGMVSDADDALEQEEWRKRYGILSEKITVALAADEEGKG